MLTAGDLVFTDTNIFLIATDRARQGHEKARLVIAKAGRAGVHLAWSGQVLREYLVVATRAPESNVFLTTLLSCKRVSFDHIAATRSLLAWSLRCRMTCAQKSRPFPLLAASPVP